MMLKTLLEANKEEKYEMLKDYLYNIRKYKKLVNDAIKQHAKLRYIRDFTTKIVKAKYLIITLQSLNALKRDKIKKLEEIKEAFTVGGYNYYLDYDDTVIAVTITLNTKKLAKEFMNTEIYRELKCYLLNALQNDEKYIGERYNRVHDFIRFLLDHLDVFNKKLYEKLKEYDKYMLVQVISEAIHQDEELYKAIRDYLGY